MKRLGFGDLSTKDEIGDRLLTSARSGGRIDSGLFRRGLQERFQADRIVVELYDWCDQVVSLLLSTERWL